MFGLSTNDLTEGAHLLIIVIGVAGYYKATKTKDLIEIQQKTIEALDKEVSTLQRGFEACKQNLAKLERMVKNKDNV